MENVEYYGWLFRRLLAEKEVTPLAPPPSRASICLDQKSGMVVRCTNPNGMVMVLGGMAVMVFLVCIAVVLLCYAVVKQRRHRRQQQLTPESSLAPAPAPQQLAASAGAQYDDAVLVQLPGEEKPQLFAIPKPFLVDGEKAPDRSSRFPVDEKATKEADSEPPDVGRS